MPGRGFGTEQARVALIGLGSPRPVIVEEVILSAMPDCSGIGSVLWAHERSLVLKAKTTAELVQSSGLAVQVWLSWWALSQTFCFRVTATGVKVSVAEE